MVLFYVVVVLGVLVFIRYSLWREKYSRQFPGVKPGFFNVLGDLSRLVTYLLSNDGLPMLYQLVQVLRELTEKFQHQKLFCVWDFYKPQICIVKAEAVKQLLSKGPGENEKNWTYDYLKPLLGTGLVTSPVEKWKSRRKLLMPCFHADILRDFLIPFNECSQKLVKHLQQETKKEFTFIFTPVTLTALDIINETMFGITVGALENNSSQYVHAINRLLDIYTGRMLKFWEWPDFLFQLISGREAKRHLKIIEDFTKSVIEDKKKQYLNGKKDSDKSKRKALMDMLLELHLETQELSEQDIREEVNTFVTAGHETVSLSITWALYLIGLYPEVQTKIQEELDRIFGTDMNRDVTENDLNELKYLDCVLKETNRLYSITPVIGRCLREDKNICGYKIPKGSDCFVLIYFLHRDKDVYPDPERFDPDRFLPENSAKIPDYGYIPFSAGPRNCIGQRFAVMEIKTIISSILRNYSIESLDVRDKVLPIFTITLHPSIPIRIRIRPRRML